MSTLNRPRPCRIGPPDPAELGEHYRLRDATLAALRAYLASPGPVHLKAATEAVAAWRARHGPLTALGFLWTIDGAGELLKFKATKRGKVPTR